MAVTDEWANESHPLLAVGTLDNVLETKRRLRVDTSPLVGISHRRDPQGRFEWIGLQNHSGHLVTSIHKPIPISHIKVQLESQGQVRRVSSLTNNATLTPRELAPGHLAIVLPRLEEFEIVLVEYADLPPK